MGNGLVKHCPLFRASIEDCERALSELPDGPSWSLTAEAAKGPEESRVDQAEISQPLCTALQIALVDLLRASRVQFDVVVGHSSGEIGAAYAAGVLNARDAVRIAYYRGVAAQKVLTDHSGRPGAMMVVGMSFRDATAFCSQPQFVQRLRVAASNAPTSVTMSGDHDAIHEAKASFDGQDIFARLLRIDVAYHSHHMAQCAQYYSDCLQALDLRPHSPRRGCVWYSTVDGYVGSSQITPEQLECRYWVENMVNPVMFSQSIELLVTQTPDVCVALEVGPHPTLRSPVGHVLKDLGHPEILYKGCLNRGRCDIESLSKAIGALWSYIDASAVDFGGWRGAFGRTSRPPVLKGLPSYAWDHSNTYWHEPRLSRQSRLHMQQYHKLLGHVHRDWPSEMEWRNVFRQTDLPWLRGHTFQGQAIFPAAGYLSMAIDAALAYARGRPVKLLEALDVNIFKALAFSDTDQSIEIMFIIRDRSHTPASTLGPLTVEVEFACYSCTDGFSTSKNCGGRLRVYLGTPDAVACPQPPICEDELPPLDTERFFASLRGLGIEYDGPFRAISSLRRIWGTAQAQAVWEDGEIEEEYSLHPATLDVAFQTGFSTFISIADKAMASAYLPHGIRRLVIDPNHRYRGASQRIQVGIDACLAHLTKSTVEVDAHVYDGGVQQTGIQIDGLVFKAIAEPQACDDRNVFAKTVWEPDVSFGFPQPPQLEASSKENELIVATERTTLYYLRHLRDEIPPGECSTMKWYHQCLMRTVGMLLDDVCHGHHAILKKEWLDDNYDVVRKIRTRFPDSAEIALLTAVGENLPSVVRGQSEMLEHMLEKDLLGRFYREGRGLDVCNNHVANLMRSISHKYPRNNILEVGAGTGATTRRVLEAIGDSYGSYTYTDISPGFFETVASSFAGTGHRFSYKTFNAESDPSEQGFIPGSYDVVIAANVLHATSRLTETIRNVRSLLRPGGFLIAVEVTGNMLRDTGLMGGLEGWWLGVDDGRSGSPGISLAQWDRLLSENGFSEMRSIFHDFPDPSRHNCSVFVTQARDGLLNLLIDPLSTMSCPEPTSEVLVIGGKTEAVSSSAMKLTSLLRGRMSQVTVLTSIDEVDLPNMKPGTNIVSLTELDEPTFSKSLNPSRLNRLQRMLADAGNVLWVISVADPYTNMMVGVGRALAHELSHVKMQFLAFDQPSSWSMDTVAQSLLRMVLMDLPEFKEPLQDLLWNQEPEIEVRGDTVFIPRVVSDDAANECLNNTRRRITKIVDQNESIEVSYTSSTPSLVRSIPAAVPPEGVQIDVQLSFEIRPDTADATPRFLCFGRLRETNGPALVLNVTNSSTVISNLERVFELPTNAAFDAKSLLAVGAHLIALHVLSKSPATGTILLHEPAEYVAKAIANAAATRRRGGDILAITVKPRAKCHGWITVNRFARFKDVRTQIPGDAAALWRFSNCNLDNILPLLPEGSPSFVFESHIIPGHRRDIAAAFESTQMSVMDEVPSIIDINDYLARERSQRQTPEVLSWKRHNPIKVLMPPGLGNYQFAADKTYFLVGMAGELGQSLCRFMVRSGARNIVVASRNARSDAKWLRSLGVNIRAVKMDVTDQQQVRTTVTTIRETMPEIVGVANASLTLIDAPFVNTSLVNVEQQLRSKVDGTIHLDREFSHQKLDFFILFSSLGTVYGNPGQSIYHAANMFMTAFAAQRRRRGQEASVIDVGMISDVGYVAKRQRADNKLENHLQANFFKPLSETEFHHLFVQAILAGDPRTERGQLTMGIEPFVEKSDLKRRPVWYGNPRFSHMIKEAKPAGREDSAQSNTIKNLRKRLKDASSATEAGVALQELFCTKLESMFQLPPDSINITAPLSELGLDSLSAVEIRSWLLKETDVEVPMFGILGSESVASIVSKAAEESVGTGADTSAASAGQGNGETRAIREQILEPKTTSPRGLFSPDAPKTQALASNDCQFSSGLTSTADKYNVGPQVVRNNVDEGRASYAQAALGFLHRFLDDETTFNVTAHYSIEGSLDFKNFSQAFERTLGRHEMYRTCFFTEPSSGEFHQGVKKIVPEGLLTHIHSTTDCISDIFQTLSKQVWDLPRGYSFRAILVSHTENSHSLVIGCHHIIMDGVSWHIFLRDLNRAYQKVQFSTTSPSTLEFARRQIKAREDGAWKESTTYWTRQWAGSRPNVLPLLPLSKKSHRVLRKTYRNHITHRNIDGNLANLISKVSQECAVTPMQFYLAVFQALLVRLTHHEDICVGVAVTGRGDSKDGFRSSEIIGHFTNLLPMRFRVPWNATFVESLQRTSETVLAGLMHAQVPFDYILDQLGIQRSADHTPLFQVAFNYRIGDLLHSELGNCAVKLVHYEDAKTPYDLTINVTQAHKGSSLLELVSDANIYSKRSTETIMDIYLGLLRLLALESETKVKDCVPYEHYDQTTPITLARGPTVQYRWPETLTERFQEVCATFPDATAIKDCDRSVTYAQLAEQVETIAVAITRIVNASRGARIAVLCEPGLGTYAALLGILHVGAIYVPLDARLPAARRHSMLEASKPVLLLHQTITTDAAKECAKGVPMLDLSNVTPTRLQATSAPLVEDEGFLLFTSGSTGVPKGIRLTQSGLMNYAGAKQAALCLGPGTKVLQQSSLGFDASLAQIVVAFATAGTLVTVPMQSRGDPSAIAELMVRESVSMTIGTPSEYLMLLNHAIDDLRMCQAWKNACIGGEVLTDGVIAGFRALGLVGLTLTDCYGPTETSAAVTFQTVPVSADESREVSVGHAIPNMSVYIIDENGRLLPAGFAGEICICGRGVAKGYIDKDATAARFVQDILSPADEAQSGPTQIMYKTGDKGCLSADGSLVFLGRLEGDAQVKLRGFRIELDEVAGAIVRASHGTMVDAVVTVRGRRGSEFLVAHVVPSHGAHLAKAKVDEICALLPLPQYMVPSIIVAVPHLPLTPNGKIDRKAASELDFQVRSDESENDRDESLTVVEGELRMLWAEVLGDVAGAVHIAADTDFFTIGGSSLLLVRLQGALKDKMGVRLTLHELYYASTLRSMAAIAGKERGQLVSGTIDWKAETVIPEQNVNNMLGEAAYSAPRTTQREVMLTGAAGFLGSEILAALLEDTSVAKVHCIAVPTEMLDTIASNAKVAVYPGSLTSPTLGLSSDDISTLRALIDQIIHTGSQGHCLNNYTSVKTANYLSTQFLAQLAASRQIPLHFVSSPRVILFQPDGAVEAPPVSMAAHLPPDDGSQGFTASKWASEVFLEAMAARARGLPVVVHRPCSLVGERASAEDALNAVVRYSCMSRCVPDVPGAVGFFDFRDVTGVALEIASGPVTPRSGANCASAGVRNETQTDQVSCSLEFRHYSSGVRVPFGQLASRMGELYGGTFETVSLAEWIQRAVRLGIPSVIVSYLEANVAGSENLTFPYMGSFLE